jgi:hypothetical protein
MNNLKKIEDRRDLKTGKRYTHKLDSGGVLIWRRGKDGIASWSAGIPDGKGDQIVKKIGQADDTLGGIDFKAACAAASTMQRESKLSPAAAKKEPPQTIGQALTSYRERLRITGRKVAAADWLRGLFSDKELERPLTEVTAKDLGETWQSKCLADGLAESTINKAIGQLKPAFDWAAASDPRIDANSKAWQKGFTRYKGKKAKVARKIKLTDDQVLAAVADAYDTSDEFGVLVQMHADYGTRTSQLARIIVDQLQGDRVEIPGDNKGNGSREPRSFQVKPALLEKLRSAAAGQPAGTILLRDENGKPWLTEVPGKNELVGDHHHRLWRKLARKLKFPTEIRRGRTWPTGLYALRHSSIDRMIKAGVPIKEIADIHFTGVRDIEEHYHRDVAHDDTALAFDSSPTEPNVVQLPVNKAA